MEHDLFKPQTLEEGQHGVVGDCNGIPMETRYREETPMFAKKILYLLGGLESRYEDYFILDYGCGVGRLSQAILDSKDAVNITIAGVDSSKEMRKLAEENIDNHRFNAFSPQDFTKDIVPGLVDLAVLVYVLQHIPAIEIREALQRIHYSLRDDGILFYCSSDYRMTIRYDGKGFFDDRFLGVNLQEELSRYFDLVGPAFTEKELKSNEVVRKMVTGEGGGLAHPALIYRKKKIDGPLFNAVLEEEQITRLKSASETPEQKAERDMKFNEFINDQKKGLIPGRFNPNERRLGKNKLIVRNGEIVTVPVNQKLVLIQKLSPGDIMMATIALRDLHKAYPGEYVTDVRTPCNDIFKNNPYVTKIIPPDPVEEMRAIGQLKAEPEHKPIKIGDITYVNLHYPLLHDNSNEKGVHFSAGMPDFLSKQLGRPVPRTSMYPELYLDQNEKLWKSPVTVKTGYEGKYWVINAGVKSDCKLKGYPYYQNVVNILKDQITFVQAGLRAHIHKPLTGAIDMLDKTNIREFFRLVYHAEGVLTCVSFPMHVAASLRKPCVVVAGGREGTRWEMYPNHRYIYVNGALTCCKDNGCWKYNNDDPDKDKHCVNMRGDVPLCMKMIRPEEVARQILMYYEGGVLQ